MYSQDIIGTPSRLLLDDDTLANGIIYLQDRDSGLSVCLNCVVVYLEYIVGTHGK